MMMNVFRKSTPGLKGEVEKRGFGVLNSLKCLNKLSKSCATVNTY